jgi:hypothetical protein
MFRRVVFYLTLGAIGGLFLIPLNPVNSLLLRLAFLGATGGAWLGLLLLLWKWKSVRVILLLLPVFAATLLALPGKRINGGALREEYVARMRGYEGTRYFWGGENSRGIDCSGLPRRALREALWKQGWNQADGELLRMAIGQWWFDSSAKAMAEGYRGNTRALGGEGTVRDLDLSSLSPGDLAVTANGVHVMVYVGSGQWIQAEPSAGKVITLDGRSGASDWFDVPVTTHRWQVLE